MADEQDTSIPPGWVGGFEQSNPAFAYPDPDLSSLPLLCNMANIDKLDRQQAAEWPQFSWLTKAGDESSRCFQMFSPDISRIGYTNEGRVYSIICPQQGSCSPNFGCLNVEVSVTGQRGWVDETTRQLAADLTIEGKIWFTPLARELKLVTMLEKLFKDSGRKFPMDKKNSIVVTSHDPDDPSVKAFPARYGETTRFTSPEFARHPDQSWSVANVEVGIGPIVETGDELVDEFNALVMRVFNLASGNLLAAGGVLSWNIWISAPTLVDREEWWEHAKKWRDSIDADHGSPGGPGTKPQYRNGDPFRPIESAAVDEVEELIAYLWKNLEKFGSALEDDVKAIIKYLEGLL